MGKRPKWRYIVHFNLFKYNLFNVCFAILSWVGSSPVLHVTTHCSSLLSLSWTSDSCNVSNYIILCLLQFSSSTESIHPKHIACLLAHVIVHSSAFFSPAHCMWLLLYPVFSLFCTYLFMYTNFIYPLENASILSFQPSQILCAQDPYITTMQHFTLYTSIIQFVLHSERKTLCCQQI